MTSPNGETESPSPGRILVIEDAPETARLLENLLSRWGYEFRIAKNGETGLAQLCSFEPTVVLCDIWLPGEMDGYAVADSIHGIERFKHVPLIAMTAHNQFSNRGRSLTSGFQHHLAKPFTGPTLKQLLERLRRANGRGAEESR